MSMTTASLTQMLANQLVSQEGTISQLQTQVASGQKLNKPSDNPAAVTEVLSLSSQASQLTSWQSNAGTAQSWLGTASSAVNSSLEAMQNARTLLLQAANQGTQNATSYKALGSQLQGVVANLLSLSNTVYEGRAIFAGTAASQQAYDSAGNYLGNSDAPTAVIGPGSGVGTVVDMSLPGTAVFGAGTSNIFSTLNTAANALLSGSPTSGAISAALNALDGNVTAAQLASGVLGTASAQVTSVNSALTSQLENVQASQANLADVNVASATTQLNLDMANYQAALWAASRAIPETLQQFIAP